MHTNITWYTDYLQYVKCPSHVLLQICSVIITENNGSFGSKNLSKLRKQHCFISLYFIYLRWVFVKHFHTAYIKNLRHLTSSGIHHCPRQIIERIVGGWKEIGALLPKALLSRPSCTDTCSWVTTSTVSITMCDKLFCS